MMRTKTTVKVISLYDLIANNILLILVTLHHIIILSFNHYSIEYIDRVKLDFPEQRQQIFEEILLNLEYCQVITLFTILIIYLAHKFMYLFTQFNLEQIRFGIMCCSFITKMLVTLCQLYYHYDNNFHTIFNSKTITFLIFIDASYMISFVILINIIVTLLIISIGVCLDKCILRINNFAKNYKITYIERNLVEDKHYV